MNGDDSNRSHCGETPVAGNAASGEGVAGSIGTGAIAGAGVAFARGVGAAVQATDASRASTTNGRIANSPSSNGQVTGQPTASRRKQARVAVQSASGCLTALEASP
jgi:hypothetical protein